MSCKYDVVEDMFMNIKTVYSKDVQNLKLDGGANRG